MILLSIGNSIFGTDGNVPLVVGLLVLSLTLLVSVETRSQSTARYETVNRLKSLFWPQLNDWKCRVERESNATEREGNEKVDHDDSRWERASLPFYWEKQIYWFRTKMMIPEEIAGKSIDGESERTVGNSPLDLSVVSNLRAEVYVDGKSIGKIPFGIGSVALPQELRPGTTHLVALRVPAGKWSGGRLEEVQLESEGIRDVSTPVRSYLDRIFVAQELINASPDKSSKWQEVLDKAVAELDIGAMKEGDVNKVLASVERSNRALQPLRDLTKSLTIYLPGQSHIDLAWLWRWTETVEKCRKTFSRALELMEEYPEYHYSQSMAQVYVWMEEYYPDLFKKIRQRVKEGRWEIVGGMWVEPDCNMLSGESFVRQLLYGKRYFQQEFGVDVKVGWNVDTFGYNWNLPQFYRKAGVEYFVTMKLMMMDTEPFPYHAFVWQAPDGSRVQVHWPIRNFYGGNREDFIKMVRSAIGLSKESGLSKLLYPYGKGDGGGGPIPMEIEGIRRLANEPLFFTMTPSSVESYFSEIPQGGTSLPVWNNEIYNQFHRGTYTTHADNKANNRRAEYLVTQAETFSSFAASYGLLYPHKELTEIWKKVLFNQQHDILPGTSIPEVHQDAVEDYRRIFQRGRNVLNESLHHLAAQVNTESAGIPLIVSNPLAWTRTDVAEVELDPPPSARSINVLDDEGKEMVRQVVNDGVPTGKSRLLFIAEAVPSMGYKVFHIKAGDDIETGQSPIAVNKEGLENEFFKIELDPATGTVRSIRDKRYGREVLEVSGAGNLLQAFSDSESAWDLLGPLNQVDRWDLTDVDSIDVIEKGPVRAMLRVTRRWRSSRFVQDIILYRGIPRIDCRMTVDWHEKRTLLKVAFPVSVKADSATYEIPYAAISRSTGNTTLYEQSQYEVPALQWADLSDRDYGVSLLNDSKYGCDIKGSQMRLTLLRGPSSPDPHADEGEHHFTYSLYPHADDWRTAGTVHRGYELNAPLLVVTCQSHNGVLPSRKSFLEVSPMNVVAAVVKRAEDSEAWIVRLYESTGQRVRGSLKVTGIIKRAAETDLLEREIPSGSMGQSKISVDGSEMRFDMAPYEIKTLKLEFQDMKQ